MASRKWLYSYRMLTARLREGVVVPTPRTASLAAGSGVLQPQQTSVNSELTEGKPAKPALFLTTGEKKR